MTVTDENDNNYDYQTASMIHKVMMKVNDQG